MSEKTNDGAPGMKASDLAKHIKDHLGLSWEDTCAFILRLTAADIAVQTQIKEQTGNDPNTPKALQLIVACTAELGWGFALPEDEDLNGFIIGNEAYINKVLGKIS